MAAPIPRNLNRQYDPRQARQIEALLRQNQQNILPPREEPQRLFINEARLPPERVPLYVNRGLRWAFFFVLEAIIIMFSFRICGHIFDPLPELIRPLFSLVQLAMFILLTHHAIFRLHVFD